MLLPVACLVRRADLATVVGAALAAKAAGAGHRPIAAELGRAPSTVRGWLRAFAANAGQIRTLFTALLSELDPLTRPGPAPGAAFAGAVAAIGAAAARRRLGVAGPASPWQYASAVTGGLLLAPPGSARPAGQHELALGGGGLSDQARH